MNYQIFPPPPATEKVVPVKTKSAKIQPILQDAKSRNKQLEEIATKRGIVRELDADYIAWSMSKTPDEDVEPRGKARCVRINMLALCSPDAKIFENGNRSITMTADDRKIRKFTATTETRCVRDIKRVFSWKIYGLTIDQNRRRPIHYVRVSFENKKKDQAFEILSELLDAIAAKRHVILPRVNPFGIGMDTGVQGTSRDRLYIINNCAKQTPALRRVAVDFEIHIDNEWKRLDLRVDRFGFATYQSAPRRSVLDNDHEDIHFNDDPFVRFARMTLRFGERPERAYIDIEAGENSYPHVTKSRRASIVYLPRVRVRTSDGSDTRRPIRTMTRMIFRDKEQSFLRHSAGKLAATEAEKLAALICKTMKISSKHSLGIKNSIKDSDIISMPMRGIISQKGYMISTPDSSHKIDTREMFQNAELFAHPSSRHGITLVAQSRNGEFVLRQHIENPIDLISSVTADGFSASSRSTLITTHPVPSQAGGTGTLHYAFANGEPDAARFVDKIVRLITSIDAAANLPSRLPLLTRLLAEKQRNNITRSKSILQRRKQPAKAAPALHVSTTVYSHSRSGSEASSASSDREPTDWEIYKVPGDEPAASIKLLEIGTGKDELTAENMLHELEGQGGCRVSKAYKATLPREVDLEVSEWVRVEYRNNHWCFVRREGGEEGWVPTGVLEV